MNKSNGTGSTRSQVNLNFVDRVINAVSPKWGLERIRARATISALDSTGFIGPGSGRRSVASWHPGLNTADEDIIPNREDIVAGSRDLSMNTPIATAALKRIRTNVVGGGLTLQSRIDYDFLGITEVEAEKWERDVEREFNMWARSKYCDSTMTQNFFEMQASAVYNAALSGEVFAILPMIKRPRSPYSTCIKLIESDMCASPAGQTIAGKVIAGIEYDDNDAPLSYWFKSRRFGNYVEKFQQVAAFGKSGRVNVLHLFERERPGQRRGIPILAPVMEQLKQLGRYSDAELMSTIISSFFTVFIKTDTPSTPGFSTPYNPFDGIGNPNMSPSVKDENKVELGAGAVVGLGENQSIDIANPTRPNANFEPFFLAFCKQIGSALEIPFEQLILHFSSSYSASRAALLEAWKYYRLRRQWVTDNFNRPIYFEWLTEAILLGRIKAPGFLEDPAIAHAWSGSVWGGPGMGQIDPLKETKAARERINGRLSTYEDEFTSIHGGTEGGWEGSVRRLSREERLLTDLDLVAPPAIGAVSGPAGAPPRNGTGESNFGAPAVPQDPANPDDDEDETGAILAGDL